MYLIANSHSDGKWLILSHNPGFNGKAYVGYLIVKTVMENISLSHLL